jgi:hypothetical protein
VRGRGVDVLGCAGEFGVRDVVRDYVAGALKAKLVVGKGRGGEKGERTSAAGCVVLAFQCRSCQVGCIGAIGGGFGFDVAGASAAVVGCAPLCLLADLDFLGHLTGEAATVVLWVSH